MTIPPYPVGNALVGQIDIRDVTWRLSS